MNRVYHFKIRSVKVLGFLKAHTTHFPKNYNHLDSWSVLVTEHMVHECGAGVPVESRENGGSGGSLRRCGHMWESPYYNKEH